VIACMCNGSSFIKACRDCCEVFEAFFNTLYNLCVSKTEFLGAFVDPRLYNLCASKTGFLGAFVDSRYELYISETQIPNCIPETQIPKCISETQIPNT